MRRFLILLCVLATAGCAASVPPAIAPESITFAPALQVDLSAMERTPTGVYYRDLVVGQGPPVRRGYRVAVHFAGFLPDGTQFENMSAPQPPVEFELGAGTVIRGWESGLIGMRSGGQRQLVVPASQGYGSRQVGRVPPNATLVFVIKLVSAR
ncbi:FKBP-type peptidyl-prolyl cis-trans isomerase [Longimicrobium sp.]|uniref:FKBP-type peptidyl-prolyl cis-trans isomerase n=1 Tax=Longimicrobium sp. TaxID=2029185 RepID=UPI003B3A166C